MELQPGSVVRDAWSVSLRGSAASAITFLSIESEGWLAAGSSGCYPSTVPDTPGNTLTSQSRIATTRCQVSCDLAGETAIVNFENGVYYGLDAVGTQIWNRLAGTTFGELCDSLIRDYDVEPSRLEADVRSFLRELAEQGLIEIT